MQDAILHAIFQSKYKIPRLYEEALSKYKMQLAKAKMMRFKIQSRNNMQKVTKNKTSFDDTWSRSIKQLNV